MKLSSISLIAVTLAAITGCAIATPVPLHVRALQQGERDIGIYSREAEVVVEREVNGELVDNLFTRHNQLDHETVAKHLRESALFNERAYEHAIRATQFHEGHDQKEWFQKGEKHTDARSDLDRKADKREAARGSSHQIELHADMDFAKHHRGEAKKTIVDANRAVAKARFVPTGAGSKALYLLGGDALPAIIGQKSVYDRVNHVHT